MRRPTLNALLDAAAAVLLLGALWTGFLLEFVLPPGSGRVWSVAGWARHDWARLHALVTFGLLAAVAGHVALHWKWVSQMLGRLAVLRVFGAQKAAVLALTLAVVVFAGSLAAVRALRQPATGCDHPFEGRGPPHALAETSATRPSFAGQVAQILLDRCVRCHGERDAAGGIRLDDYGAVAGVIELGHPERSRLITALKTPTRRGHAVDPPTIAALEQWILDGAPH